MKTLEKITKYGRNLVGGILIGVMTYFSPVQARDYVDVYVSNDAELQTALQDTSTSETTQRIYLSGDEFSSVTLRGVREIYGNKNPVKEVKLKPNKDVEEPDNPNISWINGDVNASSGVVIKDLAIKGYTFIRPSLALGDDGLNLRNVLIENCYISSNTLRISGSTLENVSVENCVARNQNGDGLSLTIIRKSGNLNINNSLFGESKQGINIYNFPSLEMHNTILIGNDDNFYVRKVEEDVDLTEDWWYSAKDRKQDKELLTERENILASGRIRDTTPTLTLSSKLTGEIIVIPCHTKDPYDFSCEVKDWRIWE